MKPHNRIGLALYLALTVSLCWAQTPAEKKIEQAQASITLQPQKAEFHSALGLAYTQRARETADPAYYDKALAAVDRALKLDSTQIEARRVQIWALLGKHEFAQALSKRPCTQSKNAGRSDDIRHVG